MKSVAVFCGSSFGNDPAFLTTTRELGSELARQKTRLIYGGAKVGLMGVIADSVLENGGEVTGVLPRLLMTKEIAHESLTELLIVESMHERKTKMFERSEGFIALPGGFGTLEEVVEILTWGQLGLHKFPVGFLNINGYYDSLFDLFEKMESAELLKSVNREMALFADDVPTLLEKMRAYKAPAVGKWITKPTT